MDLDSSGSSQSLGRSLAILLQPAVIGRISASLPVDQWGKFVEYFLEGAFSWTTLTDSVSSSEEVRQVVLECTVKHKVNISKITDLATRHWCRLVGEIDTVRRSNLLLGMRSFIGLLKDACTSGQRAPLLLSELQRLVLWAIELEATESSCAHDASLILQLFTFESSVNFQTCLIRSAGTADSALCHPSRGSTLISGPFSTSTT